MLKTITKTVTVVDDDNFCVDSTERCKHLDTSMGTPKCSEFDEFLDHYASKSTGGVYVQYVKCDECKSLLSKS